MAIRLEIYDGLNPILDEIARVSRGVALESLSVAGSKIRDNSRAELIRSDRHHWFQTRGGGKALSGRRIVYDQTKSKEFGARVSHDTFDSANPGSMANFITSFLMEKHLTVVVGGRHGKETPNSYRGGEVVGKEKPIGPITKEAHAILHKLNFGEKNEFHRWKEGKASIDAFNNKWKGRGFMAKGYSIAVPSINEALTSRLLKSLGGAINKIEIRERRVV